MGTFLRCILPISSWIHRLISALFVLSPSIAVLGLAEGHPILQSGLRVNDINWSVSQNTELNKAAIKMSGKRKRGAPVYVVTSYLDNNNIIRFTVHYMFLMLSCKFILLLSLHPNSNICEIVTDSHTFLLKSVIKAKLVETNARALLTNSDPIPEPVQERDTEKQKKGHGNKKGYQEVDKTPVEIEKPVRDPSKPYEHPLLHTDATFSGFLCLMIVTVSQINLLLNKMLTKAEYQEVLRQRAEHNNELVTFRLSDFRGENGTMKDIYAPNRSNDGQTWGAGVYAAPVKAKTDENASTEGASSHSDDTDQGNVLMADTDSVSRSTYSSNKRPRDESDQ